MAAGHEDMLDVRTLIGLYYDRGHDELIHRALKDFCSEELPCKRFKANAAYRALRLDVLWERAGEPPRFSWG